MSSHGSLPSSVLSGVKGTALKMVHKELPVQELSKRTNTGFGTYIYSQKLWLMHVSYYFIWNLSCWMNISDQTVWKPLGDVSCGRLRRKAVVFVVWCWGFGRWQRGVERFEEEQRNNGTPVKERGSGLRSQQDTANNTQQAAAGQHNRHRRVDVSNRVSPYLYK